MIAITQFYARSLDIRALCAHTRKAETKNKSRIMQSSSFILERSFLLECFRKQNKCDLYATWFEIHLMQPLLLGSVLEAK